MAGASLQAPQPSAGQQWDPTASATRLHIHYLVVLSDRWRGGVGRHLVTDLERWGRERGATEAITDTYFASPVSRPFWETGMGYHPRAVILRKARPGHQTRAHHTRARVRAPRLFRVSTGAAARAPALRLPMVTLSMSQTEAAATGSGRRRAPDQHRLADRRDRLGLGAGRREAGRRSWSARGKAHDLDVDHDPVPGRGRRPHLVLEAQVRVGVVVRPAPSSGSRPRPRVDASTTVRSSATQAAQEARCRCGADEERHGVLGVVRLPRLT